MPSIPRKQIRVAHDMITLLTLRQLHKKDMHTVYQML